MWPCSGCKDKVTRVLLKRVAIFFKFPDTDLINDSTDAFADRYNGYAYEVSRASLLQQNTEVLSKKSELASCFWNIQDIGGRIHHFFGSSLFTFTVE